MSTFTHFESLEFGLAEKIWLSANDKETRIKAISFYKMAAEKKDARAFLALYKINSAWITSYLITGRQHSSLPYLFEALKLGHVPSFLYAGDLNVFTVYARLIYLSTGLAIAHKTNDLLINELQEKFIDLSEDFAVEFIPEIIQRSQEWSLGGLPNISDSPLESTLAMHTCPYDKNNDRSRPNWMIFQSKNIDQYLRQLPGSDDYFLAYKFDDEGEANLKQTYLKSAASKGNGQALYAQHRHTSKVLINAAQNGSPDAFIDLISAILDDVEAVIELKGCAELRSLLNAEFKIHIDCLLYIYSLMERLGIEKYAHPMQAVTLTIESEVGYSIDHIPMSQLKYQLCGHDSIVEINDRAVKWQLGKTFDCKFHRLFNQINIEIY